MLPVILSLWQERSRGSAATRVVISRMLEPQGMADLVEDGVVSRAPSCLLNNEMKRGSKAGVFPEEQSLRAFE